MNTKQRFPSLYQFMQCYWMENGDLVYGNLTGAIQAFMECEPAQVVKRLSVDVMNARAAGYLAASLEPGSSQEGFWLEMGARWLRPEDEELISLLLSRKTYGTRA